MAETLPLWIRIYIPVTIIVLSFWIVYGVYQGGTVLCMIWRRHRDYGYHCSQSRRAQRAADSDNAVMTSAV